eukprot:8728173-Lingulodinium_polyedra.AAC.1
MGSFPRPFGILWWRLRPGAWTPRGPFLALRRPPRKRARTLAHACGCGGAAAVDGAAPERSARTP